MCVCVFSCRHLFNKVLREYDKLMGPKQVRKLHTHTHTHTHTHLLGYRAHSPKLSSLSISARACVCVTLYLCCLVLHDCVVPKYRIPVL